MSVFLTGAVCSGTLRPLDLVFAFEATMTQIASGGDEVRWPVISGPASRALTEARRDDDGYFADAHEVDREELEDYLAKLTDELDRLAPDGYFFGSNPGDGACYGFWEVEDPIPESMTIYIEIEGGIVQNVYSEDISCEVVVVDRDTDGDPEVSVSRFTISDDADDIIAEAEAAESGESATAPLIEDACMRAAAEALGFDLDDLDEDALDAFVAKAEDAVTRHGDTDLETLEAAHVAAMAQFTGRGVEDADEIDSLTIAIAVRKTGGDTPSP